MASPAAIATIGEIVRQYVRPAGLVLDPFCGTGRLLIEPRISDHSVVGIDRSPLAILASRVTHHGCDYDQLSTVAKEIVKRTTAAAKSRGSVEPDVFFWFPKAAFATLTEIRHQIDVFDCSESIRRALWLALAVSAREAAYIREVEYKLHRIGPEQRSAWRPNSLAIFEKNVERLKGRLKLIADLGMTGRFRFYLGDIVGLSEALRARYDCIVSSPPYGDSRSTVGYGEFAKVPLMVFKKGKFGDKCNNSFSDSVCLGGAKCPRPEVNEEEVPSQARSVSCAAMRRFTQGYFGRLKILLARLKSGGIVSFVLANRTVEGRRFPLIEATETFLKARGLRMLAKEERLMAWKRLPRTMKHRYGNRRKTHTGINYETILTFYRPLFSRSHS